MLKEKINDLTDAELGAKVREAHKKHERYKEIMKPTWQQEGKELRAIREGLRIPRRKVSECLGTCLDVVAKLEKGEYIQRRNLVKNSYITALNYLQMLRESSNNNLKHFVLSI